MNRPPRRLLAIASLAACALVLTFGAGCGVPQQPVHPRPDPTRPVEPLPRAGKVAAPSKGAFLGVFAPPAPFETRPLETFERRARKGTSIVMWYQPWSRYNRNRFDSSACIAMMRRGKVPMITWEPWNPGDYPKRLPNRADQPSYRLSSIIRGRHDEYIRSWARDIRRLGGPVMLRPMHEMNGRWYPWCGTANGNRPEEFAKAWRHIHDLFAEEGATNVTWVWCINAESVPDSDENLFAAYYPGDDYVDWTAVCAFRWGGGRPGWRSFFRLYHEALLFLETLEKPICVAELGYAEQGGDKAAWIRGTYEHMTQTHPLVKAVIWYEAVETVNGERVDCRIVSSPAATAAFRRAVSSPYYLDTPPAVLTRWWESLSEADVRDLESVRSIY